MVDYTAIFNKFNEQPRNLLEAVEANRLKNQQEQARQLALRQTQQNVDFNEQANPLKLAKAQFDNMSEQDKFVEQELLQGSIELQPFLDAKDSQSVMQSLQMRRNKLAQSGLRTDEIDSAIHLAQNGQFDTLKQLTTSQIQAGRMIGLLDDNRQNLPAGIQYADALAQARASGDKQRVRDILTMTKAERLPAGVTYNQDGTVSNIGGLEDALGSQAFTTSYNKEDAKNIAYSGQGQTNEQNKVDYANTGKVNTSKAINDDLQATKSYYDDLRIKNENNGRLTLQERQAEDKRLQKERDAELARIQIDYSNKAEIEKQKQINTNANTAELNQKDALRTQTLKQNLPIAEEVTANAIAGIDDTIGKLQQIKGMVGANTAGWGSLLAGLPASDANDLDAQLVTVNSRFGLDSLLSLKNKGGSLGAIAVKEFEALQSSVSNLRQSQSAEQLRRNIDDAIRQSQRTQESIERAYLAEYGSVLEEPQETQPQITQQPQQSNQNDDPLGLFQ